MEIQMNIWLYRNEEVEKNFGNIKDFERKYDIFVYVNKTNPQ